MEAEFSRLAAVLEQDGAKRESIGKEVRELNRIFRAIQFTLQKVHGVCNDKAALLSVCQQARAQFSELAPVWGRIYAIIGEGAAGQGQGAGKEESVEKYRAQWRFASEQLVFLAAFTHWIETHTLISMEETCKLIGAGFNEAYALPPAPATDAAAGAAGSATSTTAASSSVSTTADSSSSSSFSSLPAGVGLDVDDYLQGLTALPKELCRLCVNAVRAGEYTLPRQISAFISDLYSGFRLLNLRNDALRRKFDAIKYDVQRIEEVLYDMTVRGLGTDKASAGAGAAAAATHLQDTKTMLSPADGRADASSSDAMQS